MSGCVWVFGFVYLASCVREKESVCMYEGVSVWVCGRVCLRMWVCECVSVRARVCVCVCLGV